MLTPTYRYCRYLRLYDDPSLEDPGLLKGISRGLHTTSSYWPINCLWMLKQALPCYSQFKIKSKLLSSVTYVNEPWKNPLVIFIVKLDHATRDLGFQTINPSFLLDLHSQSTQAAPLAASLSRSNILWLISKKSNDVHWPLTHLNPTRTQTSSYIPIPGSIIPFSR